MKRTCTLFIAIAVILGWPKAVAQTVTILPPDAQIQSALAFERGIMPMLKVNAVLEGANQALVQLVVYQRNPRGDFFRTFRAKDDASIVPSVPVQFFGGDSYNQSIGISGPILLNPGTNEVVFSAEFAADLDKYSGAVSALSIIGVSMNRLSHTVDENLSLTGSFPIHGPFMTINSSLEIGSFDLASTEQQSWNVAAGVQNQVIGVFDARVFGEACSTVLIPNFKVETPGNQARQITNVVLTDEANNVVAGPVDVDTGEFMESSVGSILFRDQITFPKGGGRYYVKAKIGSTFTNGTITVTTVPNEWYLRGLLYGYGFRGTTTNAVSGGTATVRTGNLSVSAASKPDRAVFAGSRQTVGLEIVIDATKSAERIRTITIPIGLAVTNGSASDISNVTFYDGSTPITTGVNVLNPTEPGIYSLTVDGTGLITVDGTLKTLTLRYDLATSASGSYRWYLPDPGSSHSIGVMTGSSIDAVLVGNGLGPLRTVFDESGSSLTVSLSPLSPSFQKVPPGAQNVTFTVLRVDNLRPEDVQLKQLPLELNSSMGHYADIANSMFGVWHGSRRVGEAVIMNQRGVATLTLPVIIPANGYVDLTIKGDIDEASPNGGAVIGNVLKVVFDGDLAGLDGTYATGMETGMNVWSLSPDTTGFVVEIVDPNVGPRITLFKSMFFPNGALETYTGEIRASGVVDNASYIVEISNDLKRWVTASSAIGSGGELRKEFFIPEGDPNWHIVRDGVVFVRLKR